MLTPVFQVTSSPFAPTGSFFLGEGSDLPSAPRDVEDAELSTEYTSITFLPEIVTGQTITVSGGSASLDGEAFATTDLGTWPEDGVEVKLRGTTSGTYSTLEVEDVTEVELLANGVVIATFTMTNEIDPELLNFLKDVDGNLITDVDGSYISHIP